MEQLLSVALAYTPFEKMRGMLDSLSDIADLRRLVLALAERHTSQAEALELPSLHPSQRHLLEACLEQMADAAMLRGLVLALAARVAAHSEALTGQAQGKILIRPLVSPWTVTTLCGSTKFKKEFIEENFRLTRAGELVFSVSWFSHADGEVHTPDQEEKDLLDNVHMGKIDHSRGIYVVNVGGYIGASTRREIAYAIATGKTVRYREPST